MALFCCCLTSNGTIHDHRCILGHHGSGLNRKATLFEDFTAKPVSTIKRLWRLVKRRTAERMSKRAHKASLQAYLSLPNPLLPLLTLMGNLLSEADWIGLDVRTGRGEI